MPIGAQQYERMMKERSSVYRGASKQHMVVAACALACVLVCARVQAEWPKVRVTDGSVHKSVPQVEGALVVHCDFGGKALS